MRVYAIGDIHGHLDKLHAAHGLIAQDQARCSDSNGVIIHLGDLVDRGPQSRAVISLLLRGMTEGAPWRVVKGNHDRMFRNFCRAGSMHDPAILSGKSYLHKDIGGVATLASYGIDATDGALDDAHIIEAIAEAKAKVPARHLDFIDRLPLNIETPRQIFVHAGLRPAVALSNQAENDMLWIRAGFLDVDHDFGRLVVHGHTIVDAVTHYGHRVNMDTGAGLGRTLSVSVFDGADVFLLTEDGRQPLVPTPRDT